MFTREAFVVEHFHRTLSLSATRGSSTIRLNSVDGISIGTILYLGPSTAGGFVGNEEQITVQGINSVTNDITFFKQGGLENDFTGGNPVDFHTSIWFFNDHSYTGQADNRGTINQFEYPSKNLITIDSGAKYSGVTAADFDQTKISFIRSFMLLTLDTENITFDLESSLEANLVESNKWELIKVHDLISDLDNNLYFKLQQKETTESLGTGALTTDDFSPLYNFQTETNLPFVNSIALSFDNTRFAITDNSPQQRGFTVTAEVRDQFNFPVLGRSVQFTAAQSSLGDSGIPGTMTPAVVETSVSATASSDYALSSSSTDFLLDITAEVL